MHCINNIITMNLHTLISLICLIITSNVLMNTVFIKYMYSSNTINYSIIDIRIFITFFLVSSFSHVRLTRAKGINPSAKQRGHRIRSVSELEALLAVCWVFNPQICGSEEMKRPTTITAQEMPRPADIPKNKNLVFKTFLFEYWRKCTN